MTVTLTNRFLFRQIVTAICLLCCAFSAKAESGWRVTLDKTDQTLCGLQNVEFTATVEHDTENLTTCSYSWYVKKPSDADFTLVGSENSYTIEASEFGDYEIYAEATPNAETEFVTSSVVKIKFLENLIAPVIFGNATICYNTAPNKLEITTDAKGGAENYTYQWQQAEDGENFTDISGANESNYQPSKLTKTTHYKLVVTDSECGTVESNSVKITVREDLVAPIISVNATICYNTAPNKLEITVDTKGGAGNYTYQWQQSEDGVNFSNISGANESSYQPSKLIKTTHYKVVVTDSECGTVQSKSVKITVREDLVAPVISGEATICYNTAPNKLQIAIDAKGGAGNYTYQWQQSEDGVNFSNISGANESSYQPSKLAKNTHYKLVVTDDCGSVESNSVKVTVREDLVAPIISDDATICYNTEPNKLEIATDAKGGAGNYTYQWQQSEDGVNFSNISGANESSYQPSKLTQTTHYKLVVTDDCGTVESNSVKINVYDDLKVNVVDRPQPLCYQSSGKISVSATGAGENYTYQWQKSSDNSTFSDIEGAKNAEYEVLGENAGTFYYRCVVSPTFGCDAKISNVVDVLVYADVIPTEIGGDATICYGFDSEVLSIISPATGGDGKFSYRWMHRTKGESDFEYISDAASESYTPKALTETTEYQLEIKNACKTVYSNIVTITVREKLVTPVISYNGGTICYNTIPDVLQRTTDAQGGSDDSFTYQWEESSDGKNFTAISGENADVYAPSALKKEHYYRLRAVSEKSCGEVLSNIISIQVYDSMYAVATVVSPICYQTCATISVVAQGGENAYSYQWQQSGDGVVFQDISAATNATFVTNNLPDGSYFYRCVVSTQKCSDVSCFSNVVKIDVYTDLTAGIIAGTDSTCYGYAPAESLHFDEMPAGVDGKYTYQWQKRTATNTLWTDIIGATNEQYAPDALMENTEFRVVVSSACTLKETNAVLIRVNPLPVEQAMSGDNSVCYNQYNVYSVDHLNSGFSYVWSLRSANGKITSSLTDTTSIVVFWETPDSHDAVLLTVTDDKTGCERVINYPVSICNEGAPGETIIVRKPNSNILVCKEDRDIFYQWGFTEKASSVETPIDDSNRRYVLLPHAFDSDIYDYWLVTRPSEESKCRSRSIYVPENDTMISAPVAQVSMPTQIQKSLPITIQNPSEEAIVCRIFDVAGRSIARYDLGRNAFVESTLQLDVASGLYLVRVEMGDYVETYKLIAK